MKWFSYLYDRVIHWSRHRHASYYLAGLSFSESSFFPIPPDVMLVPMTLADPKRAFKFATIATLASAVGGLFGYLIGMFFFSLIYPILQHLGYISLYQQAHHWFQHWGIWALFIAAFSPIPYKLFTIAAGVLKMSLLPFLIASIIGRGLRFFLVTGLVRLGGPKMEHFIRRWIDWIGWSVVVILVVLYLVHLLY